MQATWRLDEAEGLSSGGKRRSIGCAVAARIPSTTISSTGTLTDGCGNFFVSPGTAG